MKVVVVILHVVSIVVTAFIISAFLYRYEIEALEAQCYRKSVAAETDELAAYANRMYGDLTLRELVTMDESRILRMERQ